MKNFYSHLTLEDKKEMGWDEEFDKNFISKIDEAIAMQDEYDNYIARLLAKIEGGNFN